MNVLLPAGYSEDKQYPVLYILHGIFGDEYSMCGDGKSGLPGLVPGKDMYMDHPGQFTPEQVVYADEKPFLIMICAGDRDSVVGRFPKNYHELYEENGIEHIWWDIPGSDHGETAISSGICNFTRYIFSKDINR